MFCRKCFGSVIALIFAIMVLSVSSIHLLYVFCYFCTEMYIECVITIIIYEELFGRISRVSVILRPVDGGISIHTIEAKFELQMFQKKASHVLLHHWVLM